MGPVPGLVKGNAGNVDSKTSLSTWMPRTYITSQNDSLLD